MAKKVLVTGISGYLGQHVAAELLRQGYQVVGSVRSIKKSESTATTLARVVDVDKLSFVEADLLNSEGWSNAVNGCDFVIHVASPFVVAEPKNESDLITPAVEGTKNVVEAAKKAGVKRLVLTSSVVAISTGKPNGIYGPGDWVDTSANIGAYAKSKALAEHAAWDIVKDGVLEMVAINPGFILGPPLGSVGSGASETLISDMIRGKVPMVPDVAMGMVDVRDVAKLHVAALTATKANGKRFIAASSEPVEMAYVSQVLREAGFKKVPSRKAPSFAIKLMALFDREAKGLIPQLGKKIGYDNHETIELLGWKPTPLEQTFTEMATAISGS